MGAPGLSGPSGGVSTVLLTGATGFLGPLPGAGMAGRLAPVGGTLICLVRGGSDKGRTSVPRATSSTPEMPPAGPSSGRWPALARLRVIAGGDKAG